MRVLVIYEDDSYANSNYYSDNFIHELNKSHKNSISKIYLSNNFSYFLKYIPFNFFLHEQRELNLKLNSNVYNCFSEFKFIFSQIVNSNLVIFVTSSKDNSHKNIKLLLDIFSYICMPHRGNNKFHNIVGVILSCSPISKSKSHIKNMKYCLLLSGLKDVFEVNALKSSDLSSDFSTFLLSSVITNIYDSIYSIPYKKSFFMKKFSRNLHLNTCKFKYLISNHILFKNLNLFILK